jgi:hypothetical protein
MLMWFLLPLDERLIYSYCPQHHCHCVSVFIYIVGDIPRQSPNQRHSRRYPAVLSFSHNACYILSISASVWTTLRVMLSLPVFRHSWGRDGTAVIKLLGPNNFPKRQHRSSALMVLTTAEFRERER